MSKDTWLLQLVNLDWILGSGSNVAFNLQDHPQNNMVGCSKEKVNQMVSDSKMFIVWLESFEDRNSFPIGIRNLT